MIEVRQLTKCYGDFLAVDDLSFEIEEGHVYGFLGPNGAGKSTTMNIIAGCLSATKGVVTIGGHDVFEEPEEAKRLIGYLPEQPPLYQNETPVEYLEFVGEAKGLHGQELWRQIEEVIAQTGLEPVCYRLISALSKGYKQRVGIAQALLGNPRVIILDEPTVGLDPIQILEIRDLIKNLGKTHTVIFSSHILSEVQAICEKVLIINHGKLVAFDDIAHLSSLQTQSGGIDLAVAGAPDAVEAVLRDVAGIGAITCRETVDGSTRAHADVVFDAPAQEADTLGGFGQAQKTDAERVVRETACRIFFAFAQAGLPIYEMGTKHASLEDVFLELTAEGADAAGAVGAVGAAGSAGDEGAMYAPDFSNAAPQSSDTFPEEAND